MTLGSPTVNAIYLDDELSGTVIEDNLCVDSQTCFFVGGGRDTRIRLAVIFLPCYDFNRYVNLL